MCFYKDVVHESSLDSYNAQPSAYWLEICDFVIPSLGFKEGSIKLIIDPSTSCTEAIDTSYLVSLSFSKRRDSGKACIPNPRDLHCASYYFSLNRRMCPLIRRLFSHSRLQSVRLYFASFEIPLFSTSLSLIKIVFYLD